MQLLEEACLDADVDDILENDIAKGVAQLIVTDIEGRCQIEHERFTSTEAIRDAERRRMEHLTSETLAAIDVEVMALAETKLNPGEKQAQYQVLHERRTEARLLAAEAAKRFHDGTINAGQKSLEAITRLQQARRDLEKIDPETLAGLGRRWLTDALG